MQTLGLSDSSPQTENRLKALLWPSIQNDGDFDYVTEQGFWVCFLVAVFTFLFNALAGSLLGGAFEGAFFLLAGMGVRQRSRIAAVTAFAAYLLSALVLQKVTGNGFGIVRIVILALLFANVRGSWLAARWSRIGLNSDQIRLNETLGDKLSDQLPRALWPKLRYVFYPLAVMELALLVLALFMPLGTGPA